MGYKQINSGGLMRLYWTPDNVNMGAVTDLPTTDAGEIILLGVTLTGSSSKEDISVVVNGEEGIYFAGIEALLQWFNETFVTEQELKAPFNISAQNYLNYPNPEEFTAGQYILEDGIHGIEFDTTHR